MIVTDRAYRIKNEDNEFRTLPTIFANAYKREDKYLLDNVRCYFEVYNIDETFTDFKFVFLVSFKDIKIASLTNLSKLIGKRQLTGASKFYS